MKRFRPRIWILAAVLFVAECTSHSVRDGGSCGDASPTIPGGDAGICTVCSQSDPKACGGVPSWCLCYPGPACCCRERLTP